MNRLYLVKQDIGQAKIERMQLHQFNFDFHVIHCQSLNYCSNFKLISNFICSLKTDQSVKEVLQEDFLSRQLDLFQWTYSFCLDIGTYESTGTVRKEIGIVHGPILVKYVRLSLSRDWVYSPKVVKKCDCSPLITGIESNWSLYY